MLSTVFAQIWFDKRSGWHLSPLGDVLLNGHAVRSAVPLCLGDRLLVHGHTLRVSVPGPGGSSGTLVPTTHAAALSLLRSRWRQLLLVWALFAGGVLLGVILTALLVTRFSAHATLVHAPHSGQPGTGKQRAELRQPAKQPQNHAGGGKRDEQRGDEAAGGKQGRNGKEHGKVQEEPSHEAQSGTEPGDQPDRERTGREAPADGPSDPAPADQVEGGQAGQNEPQANRPPRQGRHDAEQEADEPEESDDNVLPFEPLRPAPELPQWLRRSELPVCLLRVPGAGQDAVSLLWPVGPHSLLVSSTTARRMLELLEDPRYGAEFRVVSNTKVVGLGLLLEKPTFRATADWISLGVIRTQRPHRFRVPLCPPRQFPRPGEPVRVVLPLEWPNSPPAQHLRMRIGCTQGRVLAVRRGGLPRWVLFVELPDEGTARYIRNALIASPAVIDSEGRLVGLCSELPHRLEVTAEIGARRLRRVVGALFWYRVFAP